MNKKITFLFDDIDPDEGLVPNFTFELFPSTGNNIIERFIKATFSSFEVEFIPTYFADENTPWLYPIFFNNIIFLNSIRHVQQSLPEKVRRGCAKKQGRVIIFVYEAFTGYEAFSVFESVAVEDTPEFIYLTHHVSSVRNIINYDPFILSRELGEIPKYDFSERYLTNFDIRRFSCFLYYYMDCPSRVILLSFLEKTNIIDDTFISAKGQAKNFNQATENLQHTDLGVFDVSFSSYYKVFEKLNIKETLQKSLINIAVEAQILYTTAHQVITEKVFRCIEEEKPFILLSHPKALRYFKELGFMSFSPFICENYDDICDPKERMNYIFHEILRLSKIPIKELEAEIKKLKPVFEHNKKILELNHLKTQTNVYKEVYNELQ